jgi:hypothetical protein
LTFSGKGEEERARRQERGSRRRKTESKGDRRERGRERERERERERRRGGEEERRERRKRRKGKKGRKTTTTFGCAGLNRDPGSKWGKNASRRRTEDGGWRCRARLITIPEGCHGTWNASARKRRTDTTILSISARAMRRKNER